MPKGYEVFWMTKPIIYFHQKSLKMQTLEGTYQRIAKILSERRLKWKDK